MLITVIILGKYLECAAKGKTSAAIQALMSLAPDTASLVTLDEQGHVLTEDVVESSLIHHGDLLKVRPHNCKFNCCTGLIPLPSSIQKASSKDGLALPIRCPSCIMSAC
jgi:hypothetical protein